MRALAQAFRIYAAILRGVADQLDPQPPTVIMLELPDLEPDQDKTRTAWMTNEFPAFFARRTFCQF